MYCSQCQQILETYALSNLDHVQQDKALMQHLQVCTDCQLVYQDLIVKQGLAGLAEVPPAPNLVARIEQSIVEQQQQNTVKPTASENNTISKSFMYSTAAACLVVGMLLGPLFGGLWEYDSGQKQAPAYLTQVDVTTGQMQTVNVMLTSAKAYRAAQLSVSMTGAARFDPQQTVQTIAWQTELKQGKNVLPLPVFLQNSDGGEIIITMKTDQGSKEVRVRVNAKARPLSREQYL